MAFAMPARGKIAGASLTGSYASLLSAPATRGRVLYLLNDCDQSILISFDGGTTAHFELAPGESPVIDLKANGLALESGISVKHAGVAPTSGSIRASVILE